MDARIERRIGAFQRVRRHRARDQRGREHLLDLEKAGERQRARHLRAVEQREALFRPEHERRETRRVQRLRRGHDLAFHARLADADEQRRHMRERGEIARCADGAFRRDARIDLGGQQALQRQHRLALHAGRTTRQRCRFQHQDQPHDVVAQQRPDTAGMAQHKIALQFLKIVLRDGGVGEKAEARVHAIDRVAARDDVRDGRSTFVDGGERRGGHREIRTLFA